MNWRKVRSRFLSGAYMVLLETNGYRAYVWDGAQYCAIGVRRPTLDEARALAELHLQAHRAQSDRQAQSDHPCTSVCA